MFIPTPLVPPLCTHTIMTNFKGPPHVRNVVLYIKNWVKIQSFLRRILGASTFSLQVQLEKETYIAHPHLLVRATNE